ncbi:MAG: Ldh family oxidoreductase [Chloroflexota bacterium]
MVVFQPEQWRRIGRALFMAAGATESNAVRVTEALVDSSLVGHDSHGVIRIVQYLQAIEAGHLRPGAEPKLLKETACSSLVDGMWTFGQVSAEVCMKKAIRQAKEQGIAVSGLINAYHIGRLGEYSEMAYNAGVVGMVLAGGFEGVGGSKGSGVTPFGGNGPAFGTNPISFGVPAGTESPVLVDFATSAVAGGKISLARAKGVPLPPGCIIDKEGRPTTNAQDFYDGGQLLTFGAHKGYGLAVVIELLGQALTGGDGCKGDTLGGGTYSRSGSIFVAMDAGIFRPADEFASVVDSTIRRIRAIPPAPGFDEVLLPGDPEHRTRAKRLTEGVSMPDSSWETLQKQSKQYKVDLSALIG